MSATPAKRTLLREEDWNQGIAIVGALLAAFGVIIGLAISNTAIASISVSVAVGGAMGWLLAGGLSGQQK